MSNPYFNKSNEEIKRTRNMRRLEINIREINNQLADIENAYPNAQCDKFTETRYWDLYNDYIKYSKELEQLMKGSEQWQ